MAERPATKVALVGAGFIADFHLQVLKKLRGVDVVALVDVEQQRAAELARRHQVARVHASIGELVAAGKPDVAHVLVPPQHHARVGHELLDAGIGVFLEKPLATSRAAAAALVEKARAKSLPLGVNHNATFHPTFAELARLAQSGELGRVEHLFGCLSVGLRQLASRDFSHYMFQSPRNIVFEQATHPISQFVALLGPVRSVTAVPLNGRELAPGVRFHDTWQLSLVHERGTASLHLSFGRDWNESFVRALATDGSVHCDLLRGHVTRLSKTIWPDFFEQWWLAERGAWSLSWQGVRNAVSYALSTLKLVGRSDLFFVGMRDAIEAFHRGLASGAVPPSCSAEQGLAVVEACELAAAAAPESDATTVPASPAAASAPTALAPADVLVTGAAGFVGTHVVERLLAKGLRVRALVRRPRFVPDVLRRDGVALVAGDVSDAAVVDAAVAGTRAVVHLATGGGATWSDFERAMVGGTRNVAEACARHGSRRLVFTSTIAAYFLGDGNAGSVTEETPLDEQPQKRSLYARAKIATERMLADFASRAPIELVVVRPGFVVGRRGAPQHSGVGYWAKDTQVVGWGSGDVPLPFVLVDDVADAIVRCVELPIAAGRTYNLVGDVRLTGRQWVAALRARLGRPFTFHGEWIAAWFGEELFKYLVKVATRRPGAEPPSWRDLVTRTATRGFDGSRPKRELGWTPVADRERFLELALPSSTNGAPPSVAP
jgi:nucleoside-diphosphate-sugar epimerase/predicted dehydrogenase